MFFAAIATVVTIAEILKNNGFAVEKSKYIFLFTYLILAFWLFLLFGAFLFLVVTMFVKLGICLF